MSIYHVTKRHVGEIISRSPAALRSIVIQPNKPPSKEDALAERLRSLRSLRESTEADPPPSVGGAATRSGEGRAEADQPTKPQLAAGIGHGVSNKSKGGERPTHREDFEESLLDTDDRILEALLEAEGEPDADTDAPPIFGTFDPRAEAEEVDELMKKFLSLSQNGPNLGADDPADDSEGEPMSRDVEKILAEALGSLKVNDTIGAKGDWRCDGETSGSNARAKETDDPAWTLPSVPSDFPPSLGVSQAAAPPLRTGDFEQDMERRMAALRAGSLANPTSDSLDLPSVPTDQLSSSPTEMRTKGGPSGRMGFNDEDMETWCVACMEDATLICPGCDDDVFCSQCWYDMHKGPSAGYEEGLHKPLQFNKDRKNNRVAIGAS